jgi:rubrerythrin
MATTEENLKQAFAGESQANRRYLAFAQKADQEGLPEVAKLFRAAAEAETVHAMAHFRHLKGVKSTAENLEAARAGETYEYTEMYPAMVEAAERHAKLYGEALEAVKAGRDLAAGGIYVCPVCGNVVFGKPEAPCEICNTAADKFFEVK